MMARTAKSIFLSMGYSRMTEIKETGSRQPNYPLDAVAGGVVPCT